MTKCELLTRISEIQFVCVELNLYIDTHPDDADALSDYYHYSTMLKSLIESYEQQYGPLLGFGHSATQRTYNDECRARLFCCAADRAKAK